MEKPSMKVLSKCPYVHFENYFVKIDDNDQKI